MRYWVFTSKPAHFDMASALVPGETLDWPTFSRFKFEVGDLVFIYASNPVSQLIGKLEIEDNNLDFSNADPRNDLRKWPKHHSYIPWMRLRVLQSAPVPFKPLQRGSLYYHTEFKPSPYPKLLHKGEIEYVIRAFDEAMTYKADMVKYEGGVNPEALSRVTRGEILHETISLIKNGRITSLDFSLADDTLTVSVELADGTKGPDLRFTGIVRSHWMYDQKDSLISGIRLDVEDTYLSVHIDGADIEILAKALRVD